MTIIELHESANKLMLKIEANQWLINLYKNGELPLTDPDVIDKFKQAQKQLTVSYKVVLMQILNN